MPDLDETLPPLPPDPPRSSSSADRRRARTARIAAAGVLLTVALASLAAGVAFDRYVLLPRRFEAQRAAFAAARRRPDGRGGRERFHDQLARLLELTPEQRVQLDSIMNRQERALRETRAVVQPRIDSVVAGTRRQLDSLLTPDQREKLRALRDSGFGGRRRGPRPAP